MTLPLRHNPAEVGLTQSTDQALDAVYRYGQVLHCNIAVRDGKCQRCHRSVPMEQPTYTCESCSYNSISRFAVEFHILNDHTDHCPVCKGLLGSGVGGRGCACQGG